MPTLTIERTVNAPRDRTFACFSDLANAPANIPQIKSLEILTTGPVGRGTRFRETRIMFGKAATATMEITAFDPPRGYTVECRQGGTHYLSTFTFEPGGSGATRAGMRFEWRAESLGAKLLAPIGFLLKGVMRKAMAGDMDALKAAAERAG